MFRTTMLRAARVLTTASPRTAQSVVSRSTPFTFSASKVITPITRINAVRCYASGGSLNEEEVTGRILDLLKNFDKVHDPSKLSSSAHFSQDLGLDSLDTVEVVMAIEEEFSIEIPDKEADAIHSVKDAVSYILHQPDAH